MPGHLIDVGPVALSTGGPVSNTGLALHKLGIPTQLMGKIGDDLFGQAVSQLVSAYDPRLVGGMVVDPQANTSYTVVINPPGVDRIFLHCHGANDTFSADDVRYDLLDEVALFHFGYPPLMKRMYADGGVQLSTIYRRAKATGVTTSLDMALPDSSSVDAQWRRDPGRGRCRTWISLCPASRRFSSCCAANLRAHAGGSAGGRHPAAGRPELLAEHGR